METYIKQLSVFVENTVGAAADTVTVLSREGIDIRALSIADTEDYGIMRLIVDNPERAKTLLQEKGIMVRQTDVLALPLDDKPGSLARILTLLKDGNMPIEYMYAFVGRTHGKAVVVAKAADPAKAADLLAAHGVTPLSAAEIF